MTLWSLASSIFRALDDADEERSLLDGSTLWGDMNFRTDAFDCGTDPGGFYEEDL